MDAVWNSGITFIIWFQSLGTWLAGPMKFFSFLGSEEFFLLLLPILYWSVDSRLGLRVGTIMLFSGGLNEILKLSFTGPRPYWYSTQVHAYAAETSFGVPSGHAQIATTLWGQAAAVIKRPWAWAAAIYLIVMIGLSRLFLAVHFPHDVLLGWGIGILILLAFMFGWDPVAKWAAKKPLAQQIGLAFAFSILLILPAVLVYSALADWSVPAAWLQNAQQAGVDEMPAPVSLNTSITSAAALFGMLAGLAWMNQRGGFTASGSTAQRLFRLLPGLIGVLVIYLGLRAIFPRGDMLLAYLLRYIRFALVGVWITAWAPWVFRKLKLTQN